MGLFRNRALAQAWGAWLEFTVDSKAKREKITRAMGFFRQVTSQLNCTPLDCYLRLLT